MAKKTKEITIPDTQLSLAPIGKRGTRDIYRHNPFIIASRGFSINVRKNVAIVAGGIEITDKEGDEVSAGLIGKITEVDTEEFVKLYTRNIGIIFDLSSRAQKALIAVFCAVQKYRDQSHIFLPYHFACEYYEQIGLKKIPSKSTFISGISDLIKIHFLAAHYAGEGWYWINANVIFNGNRIRFVTEYRLKQKQEENKKIGE